MAKTIFKILLLIIIAQSTIGQKIEFSNATKFTGVNTPISLVRTQDGSFYIESSPVHKKNLNTNLTYYQENAQPIEYVVEYPEKYLYAARIFAIGNGLYQFAYKKDKKSRSLKQSLLQIREDGVAEIVKEVGQHEYNSYDDAPDVYYSHSPDSNYFGLIEVVDLDEKKQDYKLRATIFNRNLDVINSKEYDPQRSDSQRLTEYIDAQITNDGKLFLLQKKYGEKYSEAVKGSNSKKPNYILDVLSLGETGGFKQENIGTEKDFFMQPKIFLTADGIAFIASVLKAGPEKGAQSIGIKTYVYSNTNKKFSSNKYLFDDKLKSQTSGTTNSLRHVGGNFYGVNNLAISDDNNISFTIENKYSYSVFMHNNYVTKYISESAVIFTATNEGKIIHNTFIPKYHSNDFGFIPAMLHKKGNQEYLIYQDLEKNLENSTESFPDLSGGFLAMFENSIMVVAYEEENKIKRIPITTDGAQEFRAENKLFLSGGNEIYLPIIWWTKKLGSANLSVATIEIE